MGWLVGGDSDRKLAVPNREEWTRMRERGAARFIVGRGILTAGLPFAIMMTLWNLREGATPEEIAVSFLFHCIAFGVSMGAFWWFQLKRQHHRAAPPDGRADGEGDGGHQASG